tara:strand:- start:89 stop:694 length:606 start_codon:yes stop_codon:yes gene_type:complete
MEFKSYLILAFVCAMGAISPGPSLAVVVKNTIAGGRLQGVMTAIGHGIGLSIYAFIAVMGLSSILLGNENIFKALQLAGALVLIWIAYNMMKNFSSTLTRKSKEPDGRGFMEGFMIAFLNPKILVFLVAVFSQFINNEISNYDRIIITIVAGIIDTTWYVLVAIILAKTSLIHKIRNNVTLIDKAIGITLIVIAILLIIEL